MRQAQAGACDKCIKENGIKQRGDDILNILEHYKDVENLYLENYENAIKDYDSALALNPNYTDAYVNRGMSYFKLNKMNEACESWIMGEKRGAENVDSFIKSYCK